MSSSVVFVGILSGEEKHIPRRNFRSEHRKQIRRESLFPESHTHTHEGETEAEGEREAGKEGERERRERNKVSVSERERGTFKRNEKNVLTKRECLTPSQKGIHERKRNGTRQKKRRTRAAKTHLKNSSRSNKSAASTTRPATALSAHRVAR